MNHLSLTRRGALRATAAGAAALAAPFAFAQPAGYPSQPIRIVVPFGAGGSPDVYVRALSKELSERIKQPVIVENRPGANSMLGTSFVAKNAPADGYTLLYGTNSGLSAARAMVKNLQYSPTADLSGVAMISETYFVLVVAAANRNMKLAELLRNMREKPGKYEVGGASVTTAVTNKLMTNAGQLKHVYVPYKENSRMLLDLAAGLITAGFSTIPSAQPLIDAGKVFPIAVTGPVRVGVMPDTPTLAEALPGVALSTWTGFFVASKTPRPIVDYLHKTLTEIMQLPELRKQVTDSGRPLNMTPAQIDEFVKADEPRWLALFKAAGIEPE